MILETLRGGFLLLFRWLVQYPIVFGTYRLINLTRAPFNMQPGLVEKPGILVSNYGNYFFDDIISSMVGPVWPFAFVRDSIHRLPVAKQVLSFFRNLPIVRSHDGRYDAEGRRQRNEQSFAKAADLLRRGHWLAAFPETRPGHRSRLLKPLKPGVAHVALRAEAAAGWTLGLRIYVFGTNYECKFMGRSRIYFRWASPLEVARYKALYEKNPLEAETTLMREVENSLQSVVLEAPTVEHLELAHRLAWQRRQANFIGVQQALEEVVAGKASPEDMRRIACRPGRESLVYQVSGYALWGIGFVLRWPFRTFGKLCASDPSEEMTYMFILWMLVLIVGALISHFAWAETQICATWLAVSMWLWAWRRGIIRW